MAAFFEGRLAPSELAEATGHLRTCADCRTIAGEMARFEREPAAQAAPSPWRARIVAGLAALALLVPAARWAQFRFSPMGTLIAAAPRAHRPTEARVSRYPWAPPPAARRGPAPPTPEQLELYGAAGRVLERTSDKDTMEARHAAGVAHLLIGQTRESVAELKRAAARSNDARVWNDLAAALYVVGERRSIPSALAAADRAIALDPKLAEAYFNRALILEKQGLPADGAWKRYLELDPSSEWSAEARAHLRRPRRKQSDGASVRTGVERDLLGAWAKAELAGDGTAALAKLREAAKELSARTGDALIADTVTVIDRGDRTQRRAMAEAHALYVAARQPKAALAEMRRAEAALRAVRSPMAESAAYYAAVIQFSANDRVEAARALEQLITRVDARRHRSLAAGIHALLTNCATVDGDWGTAFREATLASTAFAEIGETANAAFANGSAALALERMGVSDEAWERWPSVFEATRDDAAKRYTMIRAAAIGLAATQRHDAAAALLESSREEADRTPVSAAAMFTELARASFHEGDVDLASRLLQDARGAANRIAAREQRALAEARLEVAEGVQRMAADPRNAAASIDRAIAFFDANRRDIDLADAHLQRGRALRASGDEDGALADYRVALEQIEKQRAARSIGAADAAEAIVDETVDLQLDRGDGRAAFAVADRAHALLSQVDVATMPEGTALIEYMLLPRRTAIFCLTHDGLTVVTVSIGRRELAERVAALAHDIRAHRAEDAIRTKAAELHRALIAPVQSRLASAGELIVVPDRELHSLPFAVLFDGERYLLENYAIRYAPSAARADDAPQALTPAVAIADPAGWTPLPFSRTEAEQVRAIYGGALVAGADATRARFLSLLQSSALVHYAGHADSDAATSGALLLAKSTNDSGLLAASEIARLSLHAHPLVVLSACGTLRGEDRHVAGMPTLARAFLTAGARAVVGTQWEVDDDLATPLFLRFHQELHAGQAPARALRAAQMAMLQTSDPRFRHPAAWSAVAVLSNV
ncbi:MAG TPA: CHAT domain-containing protein [Thermoanaerobaculia bacterium]|nr:CHAT domain-containing protein [Thermoanaerobaculia bacterium]